MAKITQNVVTELIEANYEKCLFNKVQLVNLRHFSYHVFKCLTFCSFFLEVMIRSKFNVENFKFYHKTTCMKHVIFGRDVRYNYLQRSLQSTCPTFRSSTRPDQEILQFSRAIKTDILIQGLILQYARTR